MEVSQGMLQLIARRLLVAIPTLFVVITVAFFMMRAAPGNPFSIDRKLPPEVLKNIEAKYHMDRPLIVQYGEYLGGVLHGDFGPSLKYRDKSVLDIIGQNYLVSLKIGLAAFAIMVIVGVTLGVFAALRQNGPADYTVMSIAIVGICIPSFVTAPLLQLAFGSDLGWLPISGWNGGAVPNMVLPVLVLATPQIAIISRLTRAGMIEALKSNYVRTARAKGLPEWRIVTKHALRAAVLPLVSYPGPAFAGLITGSLVVEGIFGLPRPGQFPAAPLVERAVKGRSLWDDARRRLLRNRAAVAGMIILAVLVLAALIGPFLVPFRYDQIIKNDVWAPPLTGGHLLGADSLGRDLLARMFTGLGVSLSIGAVATSVSLVIGVAWGATAGYLGGGGDEVMMRIVDVLYSLPYIFFVIILMVTFGSNFILLFVAIGAVQWLTMARIVRGQTLSLKQKEFLEAARAAGLTRSAIIRRHIVPNLLGPVVVYVTLTIPGVILAESFLSFLGLGVQPPIASLGTLISTGAQDMELAPWTLIFPSLTMVATLMCFNFIGDGLRDALDPKDR